MHRERVTDPAEPAVHAGSARAGHEVTPVVGHGAIETLKGTPFEGVLTHRFPNAGDARARHDSPAHQAAPPHRRVGADQHVFIRVRRGSARTALRPPSSEASGPSSAQVAIPVSAPTGASTRTPTGSASSSPTVTMCRWWR
ncbi:DUF1330 domain-containing protein [Streptomyces sp. NPDC093094]|uniref:DUF1330 domain-containing protein n=1 Tax=Streptomyces sp. NPDC093094 TaxID=3366026 RepID=UPI0037F81409